MENITVEIKTVRGEEIARILMLRKDKQENGSEYNSIRYRTTWGNKTALGIYETVKRLVEEGEKK